MSLTPGHFHLRQLPSLTNLQTLRMRNTQRSVSNMPASAQSLASLVLLTELDLSQNEFTKIPESLYELGNLRRINLSNNNIVELSNSIGEILSQKEFTKIPESLYELDNLRRINLSNNNIVDLSNSIGVF